MKASKQEKYDKAYLRMAQEWGKLSYCKRRQVGAIIVKDRMIISDGYNGTPTGFENYCEDEEGYTKWYVLHAEANAILKIALHAFGDILHFILWNIYRMRVQLAQNIIDRYIHDAIGIYIIHILVVNIIDKPVELVLF